MSRLISQRIQKARKQYRCDSYEYIKFEEDQGSSVFSEMTFGEKRACIEADRVYGVISIGETYIRQTHEVDGDLVQVTLKPDLHAICIKYNLYDQFY